MSNFQIFQYCQILSITGSDDEPNSEDDGETLHELELNKVYQITGKFAPSKDDILEIIITTSKRLNLNTDNVSVGNLLYIYLATTKCHEKWLHAHAPSKPISE